MAVACRRAVFAWRRWRVALGLALAASLGACALPGSPPQPKPAAGAPASGPAEPAAPGPAAAPGAATGQGTDSAAADAGPAPADHRDFTAALDTLDAERARHLSLAEAWRLALTNDATYQAAISARAATATFRAQGLALLLPQVQAGYSRSRITGLQRQPWLFGEILETPLKYNATTLYAQLQQPLLDAGRFTSYRWARARADEGDADWVAARSDLATRLSEAWFKLLAAQSTLALRRQLADSLADQLKGQEALYEHEEGSIIDAEQTRAHLANARADVISAEADLTVARRGLQAIIGPTDKAIGLPAFTADVEAAAPAFPLPSLVPARLMGWLDRARANNAQIGADRAKLRVADADVRRAFSRHAPSLNLVATWAKADSENLSTLSQRTNTVMVGLQLDVPIFSGGYDTALHAQTRDQARQAQHTLDATVGKTLVDVARQYHKVTGGAERIRALESAVQSGQLSLLAARKTYEYGVGSNLDLLKTQDNLFQAQAQLTQAELDYLQARIALEVAAGEALGGVFDEFEAAGF